MKELTPRQKQVVMLLAKGLCWKQIATELGISYKMVEKHVYDAEKRLKIKGTALLTRYCIKKGWIEV